MQAPEKMRNGCVDSGTEKEGLPFEGGAAAAFCWRLNWPWTVSNDVDATCTALPVVSTPFCIFDPFCSPLRKKFKYFLRELLSGSGERVNHFCARETVSDAVRSQDILPQFLWPFCELKMSSASIFL